MTCKSLPPSMRTTKSLPAENNWLVYVICCEGPRMYTGITNNSAKRLRDHNAGKCRATRGRHWRKIAEIGNLTRRQAAWLERWLKCGDTPAKRVRAYDWASRFVQDETAGQKFLVEIGYEGDDIESRS